MNVITRIRKSRITKGLAVCLALNMISEIVWPTAAMALTSGPSQPEVQSFEPVETTDMVNMFTGDFTYNIPLMYLPGPNGGYPINMSYHGGIGMDQEASWVGLGWNINAGALVRDVRGFADDYNGDELITKVDMKENVTVGSSYGVDGEIFGASSSVANLSANASLRYNNYKGFAIGFGIGFPMGNSDHMSMGLSLDSETGLGVSAQLSIESVRNKGTNHAYGLSYDNEGLGMSFSRSKSLEASCTQYTIPFPVGGELRNVSFDHKTYDQVSAGSSGLGFSANTHAPMIGLPTNTTNMNVYVKFGAGANGVFANQSLGGFFNVQSIPNDLAGKDQVQYVYGYENYESGGGADIMDFTREKDGTVSPMSPNLAAPNLTYDIYSVLGQGIGGNFRPFRTDVGRVHDPYLFSEVSGGSVSFDVGSAHVGVGGTYTSGFSVQRPWDYKNDWSDDYVFKEQVEIPDASDYDYKDRERVYYRMHGDKATYDVNELDFIGGMEPVLTEIDPEIGDELDQLEVPSYLKPDRYHTTVTGTDPTDLDIRIARNILIHKFKNEDLSGLYANTEASEIRNPGNLENYADITETSIFYYDWADGQDWLLNGTDPAADPEEFLDRQERNEKSIAGHNGAYKVLNENGQYYVYGLPAYNINEVEASFSTDESLIDEPIGDKADPDPMVNQQSAYRVDVETEYGEIKYKYPNTDKYLNKTSKPPYAHSYMLTSVLGADYVDIDDNGASDADLGYWVKFDYVKYAGDYKWRAPYAGANYSAGALTTFADDKGSYLYGEKELWYVSRIETKTHIVVFDLVERYDNVEALEEFNDFAGTNYGTRSGLCIEKISLYLKDDYKTNFTNAVALQEVYFEYDYSLCSGVKNNNGINTDLPDCILNNEDQGKLTLRRMWITYEGSGKGQMRPYEFDYYNEPESTEGILPYDEFSYDRWGNYKSHATAFDHKFLPYVNQTQSQEITDENASAWSLKTIHLPSGGEINMDYEMDDYAYVQSEEATQMFEITAVNDVVGGDDLLYAFNDNNANDFDDPTTRRVYFKLEEPLSTSTYAAAEDQAEKIYRDYVEGLMVDGKGERNLYFKNYTELRSEQPNTSDYVSGYVPIEDYNEDDVWTIEHLTADYYKYGLSAPVGDFYTEGFITIKQHKKAMLLDDLSPLDVTIEYQKKYHPFALAAWEHMRLNDPLMLTTPANIDLDNSANSDDGAKAEIVSSLLGFIPQTVQMFTGVWSYCYRNHHARRIDVSGKSVIRLCSPDKIKRGGGQRVKQISVSDNWDDFSSEEEQITGVVYDYTTEEDDHGTVRTISSGVAAYEPFLGGDEIALRYPKYYPENVPFNSDNRSYFEYPVNEQYFPAPVVGYRKVVVRSLNTATQMQIAEDGPPFPDGIGTTGITEYEFYTAKEFPVIVKESKIIKSKLNLPIPIPFIGTFERQKIKAAQGYVIELNDMHGQLKSVKKYGLTALYAKNPYPTSSVEYYYNADNTYSMKVNQKYSKVVSHLINEVETINHDNNADIPDTEVRLIGVEYDFFTDQRQNKSHTIVAGGYGNVDITTPPPAAILGFWPALTTVKHDCKTFVTNKVIFRSGIVSEVHTYDGRARVIMKNEVYDEQTGRPIITSINNEFEDIIYNYSHPAHWEYDRMGGAYKNIDLKFEGKIVDDSDGDLFDQYILESSPGVISQLVYGDELMVRYTVVGGENAGTHWFKAMHLKQLDSERTVIYVSKDNGSDVHANYVLTEGTMCDFQVIRSGRRNHVFTDAGTIVSKNKPIHTESGSTVRYSESIDADAAIAGNLVWEQNLTITSMDGVLNASAVLFKDEWENTKGVDDNNNPFGNGEAGIWRPYKSYAYVGDREAGPDPDPLLTDVKTDIRTNGEMNGFKFFNWQVQYFENYVPEWQWMSEITKYSSEAYELENTDRLNIKSAALYAYFGSLVVGVGANAGYHELGAEDFERYDAGGSVDIGELEADDNLGFYNTVPGGAHTASVQRSYRILSGKQMSPIINPGVFQIELELDPSVTISNGTEIEMAIKTSNFSNGGKSDSFLFTGEVTGNGTVNGHKLLVVQTKYKFSGVYQSMMESVNEVVLTGRATISVDKTSSGSANTENVEFVTGKAHTGKQSMKFRESFLFPQSKLDLIAEKTYVLSAWVSRDDIRKIDYEGIDIEVHENTGMGWDDITVDATLRKGKVIEGWQKIEFEFTPTSNDAVISIVLSSEVDAVPTDAYIDDIRISPKTGGIITYVYDSHNYRLKAMLDNNNYATFYYYDEEGNLYQVKRETARGIQTVSENRGHTKVQ